jgi:hypothetical protein
MLSAGDLTNVIPSARNWSRGIPLRDGKLTSAGSFDFAQDDVAWKLVKLKHE